MRPLQIVILSTLLFTACKTTAPMALDLAQHATAPYWLHVETEGVAHVSGSLLGVGVSAGAEGAVSLRKHTAKAKRSKAENPKAEDPKAEDPKAEDPGYATLWEAKLDASIYRGYRLVVRDDAIDLVGLPCAGAVALWPDIGPCSVPNAGPTGLKDSSGVVLFTVERQR